MDHFDRIFEAGGRSSEPGANGSSEDDAGGLLRGAKLEDPFKIKKAGPPDFEFVSIECQFLIEPLLIIRELSNLQRLSTYVHSTFWYISCPPLSKGRDYTLTNFPLSL